MMVQGQPVPPGLRRVDPETELARLAGERKAASRQWLTAAAQVFDGPADGEAFQITVASTVRVKFPPQFLERLADVVLAHWPQDGEDG